MDYTVVEYMQGYLVNLKAIKMWMHSAHHVAKGKGFLSDHNDLYGKMYTQLSDHFDILVEKTIGLTGQEEIACPVILSEGAAHTLKSHYSSPVNKNSEEIVGDGIVYVANLINSLSSLYEHVKGSGHMTLGMEDTLTSMANEYENYLYFLGQRYKE